MMTYYRLTTLSSIRYTSYRKMQYQLPFTPSFRILTKMDSSSDVTLRISMVSRRKQDWKLDCLDLRIDRARNVSVV